MNGRGNPLGQLRLEPAAPLLRDPELLADRVRETFSERSFAGRDGKTVNVTCSFGVAQHRAGGDERALFASADRALYRAKRAGKNRVELEAPVRSF